MVVELLAKVEDVKDGVGWLEIKYTHSVVGAQLVAAGYVGFSREYAEGVDPFKLPGAARRAALGRLGLDFDDKAAYPTAAAAVMLAGREVAQTFIRHRKFILEEHGRHFFDSDGSGVFDKDQRYRWIKQLYNALDMDGSVKAWRGEHAWNIRSASSGPVEPLPKPLDLALDPHVTGGHGIFRLEEYEAAAKGRTREVERVLPAYVDFVQRINVARGKADKRHSLTAKSYFLAHFEGLSRQAKQRCAAAAGHQVINLQHDGVYIRLARGATVEAVRLALQEASSEAVGYHQAVEVKPEGVEPGPLAFCTPPLLAESQQARPPSEPACSQRKGGTAAGETGSLQKAVETVAAAPAAATGSAAANAGATAGAFELAPAVVATAACETAGGVETAAADEAAAANTTVPEPQEVGLKRGPNGEGPRQRAQHEQRVRTTTKAPNAGERRRGAVGTLGSQEVRLLGNKELRLSDPPGGLGRRPPSEGRRGSRLQASARARTEGERALAPAGKRQRREAGEVLHAETERACGRSALRVAEPAGGKRKRSVSLAAGGSKSAKTL